MVGNVHETSVVFGPHEQCGRAKSTYDCYRTVSRQRQAHDTSKINALTTTRQAAGDGDGGGGGGLPTDKAVAQGTGSALILAAGAAKRNAGAVGRSTHRRKRRRIAAGCFCP